jgi:hypothetical protein
MDVAGATEGHSVLTDVTDLTSHCVTCKLGFERVEEDVTYSRLVEGEGLFPSVAPAVSF